ncbi:PREDICTED: sortilin-like [Amphimedon queenslandica]|uniref:VPS10 domain-containing protein n=1 Tax=Amphimedon queenslandica TaxID=400682 RepID=A0A1X7VBT2_AMPQE|nr:PREDICTED: sortilin-like [Amphimedon queenslandica]|eukprot:XP_003384999.1 PREDICTED: sortilin-like [Amphimedon queenslandica]
MRGRKEALIPSISLSHSLIFDLSFLLFLAAITAALDNSQIKDCGITSSLKADPHPEFAETSNSLQAQWVSQDVILVIGSSLSGPNPTNVWLGSRSSKTGLYHFAKHNGINEAVNTQSLQISRNGFNTAVVVAESQKTLYVSTNGGMDWSNHNLPESSFNPLTDLMLSPVNPSHMSLRTNKGNLYFSYNHGKSWNRIGKHVQQATFVNTTSENEFLFFSTSSLIPKIFPLYRYDVRTKKNKEIDQAAYRYSVDNNYLYVSRQNYTGSASDSRTRRFYVSTDFDRDRVTFREVQLPAAEWEDFVSVMATHETGAFIHISKAKDKEKGQLFVSDKSGAIFTLSLDNHMLQRVSIAYVSILAFDDFYEVKSMRGVYISTVVESGNHYSVITFNNGASWQRISPPPGTNCLLSSGCSLHLHMSYSQAVNASFKNGPLSVSSAVGVIIAQGSIGKTRSYNPSDSRVFISDDGGYTWKMHSNLTGTYSYGIANHGNIIAAVPDHQFSRTIWFSHDRGDCFKPEDIDTTGSFKVTKGLLMDPLGLGMFAFALGLEGTDINDMWRLIAIDFHSILDSPCHSQDYMLVTEHNISSTCILGYKKQFHITKPTSFCYNDAGYIPESKVIRCNCTYTDMECDYGYIMNQSTNKCLPISGFNLSSVCPPGHDTYQQSIHGYRLIAGDKCLPNDQSKELLKTKLIQCTGHEAPGGYVISTGSPAAMKVVGVLIFVISVLLAGACAIYCYVHCKSKSRNKFHDRVVYKRVPLKEPGVSSGGEPSSSSDDDLLN